MVAGNRVEPLLPGMSAQPVRPAISATRFGSEFDNKFRQEGKFDK
jgi:hypothetical protein